VKKFSETTDPQRLMFGLGTALVAAALPLPIGLEFQALLAWCAGLEIYLGLAWWL
jgi:hypothetical protein